MKTRSVLLASAAVLLVSGAAWAQSNTTPPANSTVRSDIKGIGLGYVLMQTIIDYARVRGIGEMFGIVLRENERMLKICREMGFTLRAVPDDPTVVEVVLPLS